MPFPVFIVVNRLFSCACLFVSELAFIDSQMLLDTLAWHDDANTCNDKGFFTTYAMSKTRSILGDFQVCFTHVIVLHSSSFQCFCLISLGHSQKASCYEKIPPWLKLQVLQNILWRMNSLRLCHIKVFDRLILPCTYGILKLV